MKRCLLVLLVLLTVFSLTQVAVEVNAQDDSPAVLDTFFPSSVDLDYVSGESFRQEYYYLSAEGGEYSVSFVSFSFDEKGKMVDGADVLDFLTLSQEKVSLDPLGRFSFFVEGEVPEDDVDRDYFFKVVVSRAPQAGAARNFSLGSLFFLTEARSDVGGQSLKVFDVKSSYEDEEENLLKSIRLRVKGFSDLYFKILPVLEFYDKDQKVHELIGREQRVFPDFEKDVVFQVLEDEDYLIPGLVDRVSLTLYDLDQSQEYYRQDVDFSSGVVILSQKEQFRELRKNMGVFFEKTWTEWLGYSLLTLMGLLFVSYGVFSKK
jgi:hypothetical protein